MNKDSIRRFFGLPTPDVHDDSAFVAWLVNTIAVGLVVTSAAFIIPVALAQPGLLGRYSVLTIVVVLACGGVLLLNRRGKTRFAATVLVSFLWLYTTVGMVTGGGIQAPIFVGYFIVVLLGGLLLGPSAGLALAVASIVSGGLAVWAVEQERLIPQLDYGLAFRLAVWGFFLTLLAILQSLASLTTRSALGRARQELAQRRESEAHQRALLDAIPELVFRIRRGGVFVDYHAPNSDQLLTAPELFLGQPVRAVMPPDVADKTMQAIEQVLKTGQAADFEYSLVVQEQVQYFDARMVASGPDEVLATVRDITERKQSEKHIQQRLNELAAIHAVSQAAASQLELDALFDLIAQELVQLFDIQEIYFALHDRQTDLVQFPYYRHCDQRWETSPVPFGQGLTSRVILSRQPLLINHDYERRSSELGVVRFAPVPVSIAQVSWLGVPIQAGEQVIGVICVQNLERENAFTEADVRLLTTIAMNVGIAIQNAQLYTAAQQELAERKRIQLEREKLIVELETKNAELERFAYTVSHDLKSPLVTIRGFLGFMEKDARSGNWGRFTADMARIIEATDKMQRLLSELVELSRIGRTMNPQEEMSLGQLARETVTLMAGQLTDRGVAVDIAPDLPVIYGDRPRLLEVLQNLVDNAVKYMGDQPHPRIEIGARRAGAETVCYVRDNGLGIDPRYHQKIFGLFEKLDQKSEGTGVGLAIVKRIVEVHGGRIWAESGGPGSGATFYFVLPCVPVG